MASSILSASESFDLLFEFPDSSIFQFALLGFSTSSVCCLVCSLFFLVSLLGEVGGPGGDVGWCDRDRGGSGDGEGLGPGGVGDG